MPELKQYKKELRAKYRKARLQMQPEEKKKKDRSIAEKIRELPVYQNCQTLLCYMSSPIEVDTHEFIEKALKEGKRVALPRCIENTCEMEFYLIRGFEDLESASFGILEPIREKCEKLTDFSGSICITPALACDRYGYRLGYGGGYYDRFLSGYPFFTLCAVYEENLMEEFLHGEYDRPVDFVVTDAESIDIQREKL